MYYAPITATALFIAILIVDVIKGESSSIPTHAFLGFFSVGAVAFLSMKGYDFVAWGILVLPMFIIMLSFVLAYMGSPIVSSPSSTAVAPVSTTATATTAKTNSTTSGQVVNLPELGNGTLSTSATVGLPTGTTVTPSASTCA